MDHKNPLHLDAVGQYFRRVGDKTIPDSEPCLESFYSPFVEGIDIPHYGVMDSLSRSPVKAYFEVKTRRHWRVVGCLIVLLQTSMDYTVNLNMDMQPTNWQHHEDSDLGSLTSLVKQSQEQLAHERFGH